MRATVFCVLLFLGLAFPGEAAAQERRTGLSPEQWRHWAVKIGAATTTWQTLDLLQTDPDVSAFVATAAPTVLGKLIYMPKGLGDDPTKRWPSSQFVVKDVVGELCVQSAPLWFRLALDGPREDRLMRGLLAAGGYGLAVFGCARVLEVR